MELEVLIIMAKVAVVQPAIADPAVLNLMVLAVREAVAVVAAEKGFAS